MDIVHQDNVSRAYVVEDSADVRLDIFRLPVQGIDIPHDAGTTDLREQIVGAVSIGKTDNRCTLTVVVLGNQIICHLELCKPIINTQFFHIRVRIGVVSQLAAKRRHTRNGVCAVFLNVASEHKERRLRAIPLQRIEKLPCVDIRAVIKGQGYHHRAVAVWLVNTLVIKVTAFSADRFPAGRHVTIGIKMVLVSVDICPAVDVVRCGIRCVPPARRAVLPSRRLIRRRGLRKLLNSRISRSVLRLRRRLAHRLCGCVITQYNSFFRKLRSRKFPDKRKKKKADYHTQGNP